MSFKREGKLTKGILPNFFPDSKIFNTICHEYRIAEGLPDTDPDEPGLDHATYGSGLTDASVAGIAGGTLVVVIVLAVIVYYGCRRRIRTSWSKFREKGTRKQGSAEEGSAEETTHIPELKGGSPIPKVKVTPPVHELNGASPVQELKGSLLDPKSRKALRVPKRRRTATAPGLEDRTSDVGRGFVSELEDRMADKRMGPVSELADPMAQKGEGPKANDDPHMPELEADPAAVEMDTDSSSEPDGGAPVNTTGLLWK